MRIFLYVIIVLLGLSSPVLGNLIRDASDLSTTGVTFSWSEVKSKSIKIQLEYRNEKGIWHRVNLGSGFLISPDGLFVTAYHVLKYCLEDQKEIRRFSEAVDCSRARFRIRYKGENEGREFGVQIISHLNEADSTSGKDSGTPDEIIKHRDFVIGKLTAPRPTRFSYWEIRDFKEPQAGVKDAAADFELKPLLPPKRVFVTGYPSGGDFLMSEGFLNLTEKNRRGYFAADYKLYSAAYLESQGIAANTKWGLRVENHMSGGAVIDASGSLVGLVVNGNRNTAGILSIENVLETFFSRAAQSAAASPALLLTPTEAPLYLRDQDPLN